MNETKLGDKYVHDPPDGVVGYNWFWCPAGAGASGYGKFLLLRKDYDALVGSGDGTTDLQLSSTDTPGVKIKVVICGFEPVVTSVESTRSNDMVAVFVRDRRCRMAGRLRKAFNVQKDGFPGGATLAATDCYPSTLNSSALWTWAQVASNSAISVLGGVTLPFTPAYKPRNLIYDNVPIGRIVDDVAARLYIVVGYDHQTNKFSFEEPGVSAAANTTQGTAAANFLIDGQTSSQAPKRLPGKIVVTFPGSESGASDPYASARRLYEKSVTNTAGSADVEEALHVGEYVALRSGSSWTNQTELDTAATQIASRYLAMLKQTSGDQRYAGIWPFRPDGKIGGVFWNSGPSHGPESLRGAWTSLHYGSNVPKLVLGMEQRRAVEAASNFLVMGIGAGRVTLSSGGTRNVWGGGGSSTFLAKVTAVTGTGHTYAIKAKLYDATAAAVSGDELLVRKAMGHAVDDLIYITQPVGGTDLSISGTVVTWLELYALPNPHGARGDVIRVIDDDRKHGLDKVRYQYP
jgi:hypothetical protein